MQLFHFDVHEDVRTIADATIEKDEVHFIPALSLSISYISYHYLSPIFCKFNIARIEY